MCIQKNTRNELVFLVMGTIFLVIFMTDELCKFVSLYDSLQTFHIIVVVQACPRVLLGYVDWEARIDI